MIKIATMTETSTSNSVSGFLSGLTYQAKNYDNFRFELYKWINNGWVFQSTQYESPAVHGTSFEVSTTFYSQESSCRYYVKGWAQYQGIWYGFTSGTFTTTSGRPNNFAWDTNIYQGGNIYSTDSANKILYIITANEWNKFTNRINSFRFYKGLSPTTFTITSSGMDLTKSIVNEAITAINGISGRSINPPSLRVTGDIINQASLYIGMRDSLNSII